MNRTDRIVEAVSVFVLGIIVLVFSIPLLAVAIALAVKAYGWAAGW